MKKTAKRLIQMNGKYILDTNIVIRIFAKDKHVLRKIESSKEVFVPSIVIGELCYGAYKSIKIGENLSKIEQLKRDTPILYCTYEIAQEYGKIKAELKKAGTPIPENDIWIAAFARHHGLPLSTNDHHFENVNDLKLAKW